MKSIEQYLIFAAIAEAGSFSAAANKLGVSKSHISKQIAALEEQLELRLIQRSSRRLQITEAGLRLLKDVEPMMRAYENAEETAASFHIEPSGLVRLAINSVFTTEVLVPKMAQFIAQYPKLHLDLSLQQGTPANLQENIDAAVTIGALPDSSYVSQRLGVLDACLAASPDYLQRRGSPKNPTELTQHNCLVNSYPTIPRPENWRLVRNGEMQEVPTNAVITLNDSQVVKALLLSGAGIAAIPNFFIEQELAEGRLVRVLPEFHFPASPTIYLVYHHRKWISPGLQAVLQFIKASFAERFRQ